MSLVDLGCGAGNHLFDVRRPEDSHWIGIDTHQGSLAKALERHVYDEVILSDVMAWLNECADSSIDTLLASCVIEHLPAEVSARLLTEMKRVCRTRAIVFTPNGFVPQPPDIDNPANEHISGWTTRDLKEHGFEVFCGLYGLKWLRGSFGLPRLRPQMFGDFIAKSTSRIGWRIPSLAYQIVCIYEKT